MSNTTDRNLLELAAKAAGLVIVDKELRGFDRFLVQRMSDGLFSRWNPLTDDGDAFRLAAMLGMETYHADDGGWAAYASHPAARGIAYAIERLGEDPCAAARRAIVRAAAEIGRQMP
jgi:hypothetical protein